MSFDEDFKYFQLRKEARTYISRIFEFGAMNFEPLRNVTMVMEGNDQLLLGEIDGALCLRLTGNVRKTQVTALVSIDEKKIKRVTLQTFKSRSDGRIEAFEKHEFSFRSDEFERLVAFLSQIKFIDLSNPDNFRIDDISTQFGRKAIIDASDRGIVDQIKGMSAHQRAIVLQGLQQSLSEEDVNILLGRRQGIDTFEEHMRDRNWSEAQWQDFFERQPWVFGYGLDYRVMRQFDREMTVGAGGIANQDKPKVDFLMSFTDYTVLVEIKRPNTPIFKQNRGGRAGTWEFSSEFMSAFSQILEQKAEWLSFAQTGDHFDRAGSRQLAARTRNAKSILVFGSRAEFSQTGNARDKIIMSDTFELFRQEYRSVEIVTFDELLDRARFITKS